MAGVIPLVFKKLHDVEKVSRVLTIERCDELAAIDVFEGRYGDLDAR